MWPAAWNLYHRGRKNTRREHYARQLEWARTPTLDTTPPFLWSPPVCWLLGNRADIIVRSFEAMFGSWWLLLTLSSWLAFAICSQLCTMCASQLEITACLWQCQGTFTMSLSYTFSLTRLSKSYVTPHSMVFAQEHTSQRQCHHHQYFLLGIIHTV